MIEFEGWPKTPRLFRDVTITEKIDGTNAAVIVREFAFGELVDYAGPEVHVLGPVGESEVPDKEYLVGAQSRKRLITPGKTTDNAGFAGWVYDNAVDLVELLGAGRHFGEWWGAGIQRNYGLVDGEKRFSLFNTHRYRALLTGADPDADGNEILPEMDVVPELYVGPFSTDIVHMVLDDLRETGSHVAPGFMDPEGVIVHHSAAGQVFKALLENDHMPKGVAA